MNDEETASESTEEQLWKDSPGGNNPQLYSTGIVNL